MGRIGDRLVLVPEGRDVCLGDILERDACICDYPETLSSSDEIQGFERSHRQRRCAEGANGGIQ